MRQIRKILLFTLLAILMTLGVWYGSHGQPLAPSMDIPSTFSGSFLAASDADMLATAYANGILHKVEGIEDSLALIQLINGKPNKKSQLSISNSVISWPAILEWHPTKSIAYVAETRGQIEQETKMKNVFYEFPKGQKMTVIDYTKPDFPVIIQDTILGENLQNVSVNAQGDLLVAGTTTPGREMAVATLVDGKIDQIAYFSDEEIDPRYKTDVGFRNIEFHPSQDVVAVNLNGCCVAFYQIKKGKSISVEKIGQSIAVGKKLSVGNWHPNGRFFIVTDVNWGKGNLGAILNRRGKLSSVAFDPNGQHQIVSTIKTGLSPEGFDLSPDGRYAVVVNMRRTYGPKAFWFIPGRTKSSLSLVKIDAQTGKLTSTGKAYGFKGALPEDAVFDQESNSIAVAIYQEQDEDYPKTGWIDFWEIQNDQLIKTSTKLYVTRGVHNLLLIP